MMNSTGAVNVLGRSVQYEQKGWDRGRWIGICTQRVKTAGLCVGLAVKSLSRVMVLKTVISRGRHAVFKYDLLA